MADAAWFQPARITERILQNGYITEVQAAELQRLGVTHLLAVFPTEAAAAAERDALEAKARAWAARGREVHARYEVREAVPRG